MGSVWSNSQKVPDASIPTFDNHPDAWYHKPNIGEWAHMLATTGRAIPGDWSQDIMEASRKAWRMPAVDEVDLVHDQRKRFIRDAIIKELWIKCMMLRIVRDQLTACYRDNGVNQRENCAHLSELYLKWMRDGYRVRGPRMRMRIDFKTEFRNAWSAKPPADLPQSRPWNGIDNDYTWLSDPPSEWWSKYEGAKRAVR